MKPQTKPQAWSASAERNRRPILDELKHLLPAGGTVLEIGSGTGQHAAFFSRQLPGLVWQPSDRGENLPTLEASVSSEHRPNLRSPLKLDVVSDPWPAGEFVAIYSANTAHIMSWEAVEAMFAGVGACLAKDKVFCLYGPFNINGQFTSDGNRRFDARLRAEDAQMGIRDLEAIESLANRQQLELQQQLAMPANNFILVFIKR